MAHEHRVLLITTGGTIAGKVAVDTVDEEVIHTAELFMEVVGPALNHLSVRYGISIELVTQKLDEIDSSNMLPRHWVDLASVIKTNYDAYDSFIIAHGTNTLGYTCAALSFALANPNKPIVLTGSQVPAGLPGSDGLTNLENALRVAVWRREKNPIRGVMAVFGSHIITGTRVKKATTFDYDAFEPFNSGSLGRIGRIINIDETALAKHLGYLRTDSWSEARRGDDLVCENEFDMRIASLIEFPGMSSDVFRILVEHGGAQGFILSAFGAGDPCETHLGAFKYLRGKEIPIVVTTQAPRGNANFQVNEPGKRLRDEQLAIPAYDMSIEAQTTKLAWLLAKKRRRELTYGQLCKEMVRDMRGEIHVMWEFGI